jgi:hypothetical protein
MSTGYHITVGYNSNRVGDAVATTLLEVVKSICAEPKQILDNALVIEGAMIPEEYADSYREPWNDLTIKIIAEKDGSPNIMQMASGGGHERNHKEAMRRAFCRLVLERMHQHRMEVNINVV